MATRRAKPVKNYDAVHITNIEDDFDEFTLGGAEISSRKINTGPSIKVDVRQSKSDNDRQQNFFDDVKSSSRADATKQTNISLGKFKSEVQGPDSIWKKAYKDPLSNSRKDYIDTWGKTGTSKPDTEETTLKSTETTAKSDIHVNVSASTQAQKTTSFATSPKIAAVTSAPQVNQSPLSSGRSSTTSTPYNQRSSVSYSQRNAGSYSQRNAGSNVQERKRVDKNEKAYGRDMQDMYIDDIEDF